MSEARVQLQKLIKKWEEEAHKDHRDTYPFQNTLDELLFHADLRFKDYIQFGTEGEFPVRLQRWLNNVSSDREKKVLFKLLRWITFIDHLQMLSLCRDAYRRILVPWLTRDTLSEDEVLAVDYEVKVRERLRQYSLFSVTESFGFSDFLHVNDLVGLPKPIILGEKKENVRALIPPPDAPIKGLIIFEDLVGTGKQAGSVISEVRSNANPAWRILFLPLIILETGLSNLQDIVTPINVEATPVLVIPKTQCLLQEPYGEEPTEFVQFRTLVKRTAKRVLEPFGTHDDPPSNAFGYQGCGAFLVTCHNTPNNTLPLIHHRAPDWFPLFRRVHHLGGHSQ